MYVWVTIFKTTLNFNILHKLLITENPRKTSFQVPEEVELIICRYVDKIINGVIVSSQVWAIVTNCSYI